MDPNEDKDGGGKKLTDDFVKFLRKRSEHEPRYTARLKTYVDFQRKRNRAVEARQRADQGTVRAVAKTKRKPEEADNETADTNEYRCDNETRVRRHRSRSGSRVRLAPNTDACGCRRRRRRRKRSCGRRRRRRRSCSRRRRRRRRRSRSRRRRRRSCGRRRRRRRQRRRRRC